MSGIPFFPYITLSLSLLCESVSDSGRGVYGTQNSEYRETSAVYTDTHTTSATQTKKKQRKEN